MTKLISILLLSLPLAGFAQECDTPRETKVSWVDATERVDGSPLSPAEIQNTAVFRSRQVCTAEELLSRPMTLVQSGVSEVCLGELAPGDWCFTARHVDTSGQLSAPSNVATKTIVETAAPEPPTDLRVDPDALTAYFAFITRDTLLLLPAGQVAAETECSTSTFVADDNGLLAYKVPVEDVTFDGDIRGELIFAACR